MTVAGPALFVAANLSLGKGNLAWLGEWKGEGGSKNLPAGTFYQTKQPSQKFAIQKNCIKNTNSANIIATKLEWEQFIMLLP